MKKPWVLTPHATAETVKRIQTQAQVLRMTVRGRSHEEIAKACDLDSRQEVEKTLRRALRLVEKRTAEDYRNILVARLDRIFRGLVKTGAFDGNIKAAAAAVEVVDETARIVGLLKPGSTTQVAQGNVVIQVSAEVGQALEMPADGAEPCAVTVDSVQ